LVIAFEKGLQVLDFPHFEHIFGGGPPGGILGSVVSTETKASGAGAGAGADSDAEPGRHQEKHVPQHANHCKE